MNNAEVAILVVNGGKDPDSGKWLDIFLEKLYQFTDPSKFKLFVWNNNIYDENVKAQQANYGFYLMEPSAGEVLSHPHAEALQKLYEKALDLICPEFYIVMDSDAFPIKKGWFEILLNAIGSEDFVLAGVWRDELSEGIEAYIHPSCMCFSTTFVKENFLRLDYFGENSNGKKFDTLSSFTDKAKELKLPVLKWKRSNVNNCHRVMAGIYGDFLYHHGAGSRTKISFWDEDYSEDKAKIYDSINSSSGRLLFEDFDNYIAWLRGEFNYSKTALKQIQRDRKGNFLDKISSKIWRLIKVEER